MIKVHSGRTNNPLSKKYKVKTVHFCGTNEKAY